MTDDGGMLVAGVTIGSYGIRVEVVGKFNITFDDGAVGCVETYTCWYCHDANTLGW
jgi:hypothetical protein